MDKKVPYLDVRTEQEFKKEHVLGSINVPWLLDLTTNQVRFICKLLLRSMPVGQGQCGLSCKMHLEAHGSSHSLKRIECLQNAFHSMISVQILSC